MKKNLFSVSKFQDGLNSQDDVYDALAENQHYSSGAFNLMESLKNYYNGEVIGASSGAKVAMHNGLVPVPDNQYNGENGEYHHIRFVGEDGESFVKPVPFVNADDVEDKYNILFSVTPQQSAEYQKAFEENDEKKASKIVRDAYAKTHPDTKVVDEDGKPFADDAEIIALYKKKSLNFAA